ncbi:Peptidoglycan/xylan/chitin deacetylase, PgdA/CDA1 family [Salegentibacter echinorum]|uniref:Peptidoglycan/xylan/chitin deacetylase, PgdA/CDA1 family n=1 Tax=Salegentibacter echinorum TaxID=1073325 RepID=A0A1M5E769_SALEC|nr:polysaccharide deacetylase family protein [Salegentibacter echinorum]SHF75103.1 Peptidoglycan/xylan/chitin deacetylase, PgdA/CDA1 family [Salegentibacter echinorum]
MNPFLVKYPSILKKLYPERITRLNTPKTLYLTFDDGPIPEITPWVLRQLKEYKAKATFFCIGDNIRKHKDIFNQVIEQGHRIGNHSFNHLNGWKTNTDFYVENVLKAEEAIIENRAQKKEKREKSQDSRSKKPNPQLATCNSQPATQNSKLFRPPYGKIKNSQAAKLVNLNYTIVMWDVLSGDFDKTITAEKCFNNVIKHTKEGSTIVFHDSQKASKNLKAVLPEVLEFYTKKGFQFETL